MRHSREAPIGVVFTKILRIVAVAGRISTLGIATRMHPPGKDDRPRPARVNQAYRGISRSYVASLYPSAAAIREAQTLCGRMAKAGYVRRVPWPGATGAAVVWTIAVRGAAVMAAFDTPAPKRARAYRTTRHRRRKATTRRAQAAALGRCINENSQGTHGRATRGCRCDKCHETHKRSA